jgi:hypothetical protein
MAPAIAILWLWLLL